MGWPKRRPSQKLKVNSEELLQLIASRRSSVLIDASQPLEASIIHELITAAQWAPNHKKTWPARFVIVSGDSRSQLGNAIANAMQQQGDDAAKVEKTRTKYLRSPYVIVVASAQGSTPMEHEENKYAVAAGIQNMLLMAHSHGLASLWSSSAKGANSAITNFAGLDPSDTVLGIVYVGHPSQNAPHSDRPAPHVTELS